MAKLIKGDVIVVPFPFSDLSQSKRRPALVLAELKGDDLILCQITSKSVADHYSVPFTATDFVSGGLPSAAGNIRPNKVFTADRNIVIRAVGRFTKEKIDEVVNKLILILEG